MPEDSWLIVAYYGEDEVPPQHELEQDGSTLDEHTQEQTYQPYGSTERGQSPGDSA